MPRLTRRLGSVVATLGVLVALARCGGGLTLPAETNAAGIAKFRGDNQTGSAGAALPESLAVKVVDRQGEPVVNQRVAFQVDGVVPGASVSPEQPRTGSEGVARTSWVVGSTSGTQAVVARVVGADSLRVTFQASVGSAEAANIAAADGNDQTAPVRTPVPNPLVVRVTDQFGNPVADVRVEWDAESGSVDPSSSETGSDGRAETSWTLGSSTGSQTATASSEDLSGSPVRFTATAVPGSANRLIRVGGNGQSAEPGQELGDPLVVRLEDQEGNGIEGRAVTWVVGAGGGTVSTTTNSTGGNGEASVRWTLGPSPGTNTLNAVVSGVGFVGFTATATGGGGGGGGSSASRLAFQVQPSDTEEDRRISPPVEVVVLDDNGDRVTDEEFRINLEIRGDDDGRLRGDRSERTESGVATFDELEVDKEGEYRLQASADGLASAESEQFRIRERD